MEAVISEEKECVGNTSGRFWASFNSCWSLIMVVGLDAAGLAPLSWF